MASHDIVWATRPGRAEMRKTVILAGFFLAAIAHGATCGGHGSAATMLVTPSWLADHLTDAQLVAIGIGQNCEFDQGHIPGSVFPDDNSTVLRAAPERPNSYELPPMADLAA